MSITGNLRKMHTELSDDLLVHYQLPVSDTYLPVNPLLGKSLQLNYSGTINCVHCGRETKKSFSQGYCYPCFKKLAQCDMCIVKPETCHYAQGTCREPDWAQVHCMVPHYVYLANSSGIKVGITRHTQIPTRWLDQGAIQAIKIAKVATRQLAGFVEVILKQHVSDRTSWQAMLKGKVEPIDLNSQWVSLLELCRGPIEALQVEYGDDAVQLICDDSVQGIQYPVLEYPKKVKSFNLDKESVAGGTLLGIKGQYLIFDTGVINIRKFSGYQINAIS